MQVLLVGLAHRHLKLLKHCIWFWSGCWRVEVELEPCFSGHQGPRCRTLSSIHCRCMVLKPCLSLCFSPSKLHSLLQSVHLLQQVIKECTFRAGTAFSPGKVSVHPLQTTTCTHVSFLTSFLWVDVSVRLLRSCLSRHTHFGSETSAHHYGRDLEQLALT